MKTFSFPFIIVLAIFGAGCHPTAPPSASSPASPLTVSEEAFKSGSGMTTCLSPPNAVSGPMGNVVVHMDPAPSGIQPSPPFVCDPVNFTISFPKSDPVGVSYQEVTITSDQPGVIVSSNPPLTLPIKLSDQPVGDGSVYIGASPQLITITNMQGINTGQPATITVSVQTFNGGMFNGLTNSPVQYPGPNNVGMDQTVYGTAADILNAQIKVHDQNYFGQ